MGIRIQVVAGYALTDVKSTGGIINDPRINSDSCLLDPDLESPTLDEHKQWLGERPEPDSAGAKRTRFLLGDRYDGHIVELSECITYEPEYGLSNVLVITPPYEMDNLVRSDDPIDYVVATMQGVSNQVTDLKDGIGLHHGEWMDRRTGILVHSDCKQLVHMLKNNPDLAGALEEDCAKIWGFDGDNSKLLFKGAAEVLEHAVNLVPDSVRLLAEHGELFTDPDAWKQLKPVLYTYWG